MKIFDEQNWILPDDTDFKQKRTDFQETGRSVDIFLCTYLQVGHSASVFLDFQYFQLY